VEQWFASGESDLVDSVFGCHPGDAYEFVNGELLGFGEPFHAFFGHAVGAS
jgi:hypothetical protein